jgi:hypothetical protein
LRGGKRRGRERSRASLLPLLLFVVAIAVDVCGNDLALPAKARKSPQNKNDPFLFYKKVLKNNICSLIKEINF